MSRQPQEALIFDDRSIKEPYERAAALREELPSETQDYRLKVAARTHISNREDLRCVCEMKDAQRRGDGATEDRVWKRLEDKHWGMVNGIVQRYLRPWRAQRLAHAKPGDYEPDDLCPRAFTKVWKSIKDMPTVPGDFNFGGLLRTTTVNLCLDAIQRLEDWKEVDSLDEGFEDEGERKTPLADLIPDPNPPPEELVERSEIRAAVDRALAQLPARQRDVFIAREEDGLSWDEVASKVGISPRTAQNDYQKAQKRLQSLLQEEGLPLDLPSQPAGGEV